MLHELPIHKLVKQYLEQASDVLKQDVLLLDQPENLRSNYAVQLCLYLSGIISSALLTEQNIYPDYVAGLSIGAWAAATVAGVISFEDGLKLVARRGELMQQAYPQGYGMTAVIGTDRMRVEQWISQVRIKTPDIYIANINASNQIVISGSEEAMQQVSSLARLDGAIVKRLAVSVPSHCILLEPQARQLYIDIKGVASAQPKIKYLSGTSARLLRTDVQILDDLTFNMSRMIDWESTVQAAWERGVRLHIEALPGTVLTGLARKIFKEGSVLCFQNTQLDSLITAMQKEQVS